MQKLYISQVLEEHRAEPLPGKRLKIIALSTGFPRAKCLVLNIAGT